MFKKIKNTTKKTFLSLLVIAVSFPFSGCIFREQVPTTLINLEIWGVFDSSADYNEIVREYKAIDPFVGEIRFRKFTTAEYKKELLDALAAGTGPDILLINNSWISDFENKIAPAPKELIGEKEYRENFVDVAAFDFVDQNGNVLGIPLSVDSLALYYNKDIFNAYGITAPPKDWNEFSEVVRKVTKVNEFGDISQFGAAMGSARNINRSTDIIDLLLMQNGVELPSRSDREINLSRAVAGNNGTLGSENALEFFTQFSRAGAPVYTWSSDESVHYSLDEFYEGDLAMMINFSWHYETIKSKNSKLNFAVAPVPQLNSERPVNVANYWAYAVSRNKKPIEIAEDATVITDEMRTHEAWQFLKFLTMKNNGRFSVLSPATGTAKEFPVVIDPAKSFLERTKRPAARRDLIEIQKTDPFLGSFAAGNLIAKSWIRKNPEAIEAVWGDVINEINRGSITINQSIGIARSRINSLLR